MKNFFIFDKRRGKGLRQKNRLELDRFIKYLELEQNMPKLKTKASMNLNINSD